MFCLPFERAADGIFQTANIVPSLIKRLNSNWHVVNIEHGYCSCKNVILNKNIKPRSLHPRINDDNVE